MAKAKTKVTGTVEKAIGLLSQGGAAVPLQGVRITGRLQVSAGTQ